MPLIRTILSCSFDAPEGTYINDNEQIVLPDGTVLELVMGLWDDRNGIAEAIQTNNGETMPPQIGYEERWGIMGMEYNETTVWED